MDRHFNELNPSQAEVLALLAEECGEVIQVVGKILRHGLHSRHPDGGPDNKELLTKELGDVCAAMWLCQDYGAVHHDRHVKEAAEKKLMKVPRYLHHAKVSCEYTGTVSK